MFSSKPKQAPALKPAPQPTAAPLQQKRPRSSSSASILAADLVVNGSLTSAGDIQIDGRVEGDVRSAGLVVGDNAVINGDVYAEDITVRGRVEGGIHARKVLLCSTCHVEGNILHEAFAVETGAFFEGNCRHSDDPLAQPVAPSRPAGEYTARTPIATSAPLTAPSPSSAPGSATAIARPLDGSTAAGSNRT